MRKTSVYLTDELKESLASAAAQSGRSEAEFIRAAIELAVQQAKTGSATAPTPPVRRVGPALIGVGVGPGAADLLTPRAHDAIATADTVVAAAISADAIGRAESIARAASDPLRVLRLEIDIA
ncbi:MAG TPA: SAM-dependent methyltransferase, partial [Acidimicrobiales bacterium]|nr:SAM-dependent methyltransferase [Acidimicrobiales bacterium]